VRPRPYRRSRPPVIYERRGEFPANAGGVRKNNRCDIFARLQRGRSQPSLFELSPPFLSSATPLRPAESVENDPAATLAVSKRLQVLKNNATNFPLVGGLYHTREAVHAE